jgi:hypothetical protein
VVRASQAVNAMRRRKIFVVCEHGDGRQALRKHLLNKKIFQREVI